MENLAADLSNSSSPDLYRQDIDAIATITLNKPQQYNPLSQTMLAQLQQTLEEIADDESVRVVILAAKGRAFCAGHDLKEIRSHKIESFARELFAQCSKMMLTITQIPQPVIAQVQGIATAAGCQLVANCDLAIASTESKIRSIRRKSWALLLDTRSRLKSQHISQKCDGNAVNR